MATVMMTTKYKELRSAARNLSHVESEGVSPYTMLTPLAIDGSSEESEFRIETKITTKNMHIETGVMILTISSPNESRMLEHGLCLCVSDRKSVV